MSASVCSGIVTFLLALDLVGLEPVPRVRSQALTPFVTKRGEVLPRPILETIFPSVCDINASVPRDANAIACMLNCICPGRGERERER